MPTLQQVIMLNHQGLMFSYLKGTNGLCDGVFILICNL